MCEREREDRVCEREREREKIVREREREPHQLKPLEVLRIPQQNIRLEAVLIVRVAARPHATVPPQPLSIVHVDDGAKQIVCLVTTLPQNLTDKKIRVNPSW